VRGAPLTLVTTIRLVPPAFSRGLRNTMLPTGAICHEIVSPNAACVTVSLGPNWISIAWRKLPTIVTT
jgi:hypothetical protein